MHNKAWKKEKDLLTEAYAAVTESGDHSKDAPALGEDEERQQDGSVKNTKTGETVYTPKDKGQASEAIATDLANADRPGADEEQPLPGELPDDLTPAPLDEEVEQLINLIMNPPAEDELRRLADEGRLSEYMDMLIKQRDAAQAKMDLRKPAEIDS